MPEYEERAQEIEILLSHDFSKMSLEELREINKQYIAVQSITKDVIHWTDAQYKAWQYMHLRIKEEENKDDFVKVGDLFYSSWGYDQTNVEFFKIVEISKTGKTCKVVEVAAEPIGNKEENNRNMCDTVIPNPDQVINSNKCTVKIERSHDKNPYTNKIVKVGEIQLRGSVYYGEDKHLRNLYRVKGSVSRSWYA